MLKLSCYMLMSLVCLYQENIKESEKMMEIVNIKEENLNTFWMAWGIFKKLSKKMWLMIILKVTKNQGFAFFLENTFLEKPQGASNCTPHTLFRVNYGQIMASWTADYKFLKPVNTANFLINGHAN